MLTDILSLIVMLAVIGAPAAFLALYFLHKHAKELGVPPRVRWFALVMTSVIIGSLFASAWLIPVIYLLPTDEGPQKEGPIYIGGLVVGPMVAVLPMICGLPSVARRFLPATSD